MNEIRETGPKTDREHGGNSMKGIRKAGIAIAALAIGLAAAGTAHAQYFGQNKVQYRTYDWHTFSSDHFEVYTYPELDSVALRVLDLAEKTDVLLSKRMGHQLGRKVPIILYGSHNDFSQTNVTPELIEGGTGGFTEVFRNRVVLPFSGSYEDLRHVLVHELVHAYMFDLLYGGNAGTMVARQAFFSAPLWFAEGMAEYFSLGTEPNEEMFLRDGTLEGFLPPLMYSGGYIVYKQGQSAIRYLVDRYGEEKLRDLLRTFRTQRNFEVAFQRTIGTSVERFDEQWRDYLKKRYWPTIEKKDDPERFARRLTHHRRDGSNLNTAPSVSPDGDRIAYYSDRRQYTDVYVMSAFDGQTRRRLIRGEQGVKFESVPSFRSALTWSPDGKAVAMTAKSNGRDLLYVVSADDGHLIHTIELPCQALAYPAWSPRSQDSVVVCGLRNGRTDLYMVNVTTGKYTRLTDDTWDEKEPTFTADGNGITFSSDRAMPVVLHPTRLEHGYGRYGLYTLDLANGAVREEVRTGGDDRAPAWSPDGTRLIFISDFGGTPNAYLTRPGDSSAVQLTDVRGGIMSVSWSRRNDRVVFGAYDRGGFDVFVVREPLSNPEMLEKIKRTMPQAVVALNQARPAEPDTLEASLPLGALAGAWPDSLSMASDTTSAHPIAARTPSAADSVGRAALARPQLDATSPRWVGGSDFGYPAMPDSGPPLVIQHPLNERGGPFAIADTVLAQKPSGYRPRFSADFAGGTLYGGGSGVLGATQIAMSDFLGDRRIDLTVGLYSNSLSDANVLGTYSYLPKRWDYSFSVFHYKDYFQSRVTSLGEQFSETRLFSDRNYGVAVGTSYPTSRFHRYEVQAVQKFVDRTFFEDEQGFVVERGSEFRSVTALTLSTVGDYTLWGYFGPVNGRRYNLSWQQAFDYGGKSLGYHTGTLDWRRYFDMTRDYSFAVRFLGGYSGGQAPQTFRIGGFNSLRGWEDFSLFGTRIALTNLEFRFPFIQQMGLVGPLPIGMFSVRGAGFIDTGFHWYEGQKPRVSYVGIDGKRRLQDLRFNFGTGIRTYLFYVPVRVDVAWRWSGERVSDPRWQVVLGPEF
jgi:WD40 repeat protein